MRIRILFLILGIACKSWAQCPTKLVNGTDRYKGSFKITVRETGASIINTGTSNTVLKVCKGQTLDFEILTQGSTSSGYLFEFQGQELDFNSAFDNSSKSHTYNEAGVFAVILVGSSSGTSYYTCQAIQVVDTPEPLFIASSCKEREVTVIIPKNASRNPYDNFVIDWKDGSVSTVNQDNILTAHSHQYSTNFGNEVSITVTGSYAGSSCSNSSTVKVNVSNTTVAPPAITQVDLNTLREAAYLQIVGNASSSQEIYQKELNGTYVATGIKVVSGENPPQLLLKLNPDKQYCFQVRAESGCSNATTSNEVCTIPLTITPGSGQLNLNWKSYPNKNDFESYTVDVGAKFFPPINDITQTRMTDSEVECGTSYCYRVTAHLKNGVKSIANVICEKIESMEKPPFITDMYTTVADQRTLVKWEVPGSGYVMKEWIRKSESNRAFEERSQSQFDRPYLDSEVKIDQYSYCYQVAYQNSCLVKSDFSGSVCTIYATQIGDRIQWTSASPFLDKLTSYQLQVIDAQGNVVQSQNVGLQTSVSVNSLTSSIQSGYQYRIEALSKNGNISVSNLISVTESVRIYVPQAFSPNGDAQHDVFLPKMLNVTQMKMVIFDRWGNPIFSSEDMNRGWDGLVNGSPAPVGSYSYRVDIRNDAGNSFTKRGVFQLIR